jgi:hypothetical protein
MATYKKVSDGFEQTLVQALGGVQIELASISGPMIKG